MGRTNRSLTRRTYLAVAGTAMVGLAGCSGGDGAEAGATTADRTDADDATTDAPARTRTDEGTETATSDDGTIERVRAMEAELADVSFEGGYVDTHAHWQRGQDGVVSRYAAAMDAHDIGATALFCPSRRAVTDYEAFLETLTDPGVEYLPFTSAPPPGRGTAEDFRSLYDDAGDVFWGIGEFKPQRSPSRPVDGSELTERWELAADLDVPVMYHPQADQEGTVEPALADNPETTFLLHGHQMLSYGRDGPGLGPTLPRLLAEYDNLYWTMDFATMTSGSLVGFQGPREFHQWYEANADEMIDLFGGFLTTLMEAGPSQVVWGTDVAWEWNTDDEVFSRVMEFTEQVLAGVPSRHHAAYKRENALAMFGISE